uniref:Uncharacterized protein n=1 Tax=Timema douglasi TaxID=61478 RepID=A0A7R8VRM7_TIMDO|nr:unnamed protein product [Timema douglasi]
MNEWNCFCDLLGRSRGTPGRSSGPLGVSRLHLKNLCGFVHSSIEAVHPTEIRTSISPPSAVEQLNTTNALANYATEAGSSPTLAWKESGKPLMENHFQCTWPGSNPDIPVFGCLVQHRSNALDHAAIDTGYETSYLNLEEVLCPGRHKEGCILAYPERLGWQTVEQRVMLEHRKEKNGLDSSPNLPNITDQIWLDEL